MWSETERDQITHEIKTVIETLLRSGDLYLERPSINDELRNVSYYLKSVFPQAIKTLYLRFSAAWDNHFPNDSNNPPFPTISFGTWVGGDRDGHPFVTSEITKNTLLTLRQSALELVNEQLIELATNLSLNDRLQAVPVFFRDKIKELSAIIGIDSVTALSRNPTEPWRQYINLIRLRLPNSENISNSQYKNHSELLADLGVMKESLYAIKADALSRNFLEPNIAVFESIGFHLAKLDIRQNSSFYEKALEQLFFAANLDLTGPYSTLDFSTRTHILNHELQIKRPLARSEENIGNESDEVRKTFRVVSEHIKNFGANGLGSLIVSMTRDVSDLLAVTLLAKESRLTTIYKETHITPLPVVPLFETIDDLKRSQHIMQEFLSHPVSKRCLEFQIEANTTNPLLTSHLKVPKQEIMIGYSDSSKDGGILSSYWNLYQTQSQLRDLGKCLGIDFVFFHGRGGTITRGAGPTNRFLGSLPHGTLTRGFKMTEQGETIAQKYGNLLTCSYNLELLQAGTISKNLLEDINLTDSPRLNESMEILSEKSLAKYQTLLTHEHFVGFFREATPIDAIEQSKIGSRPPKRTGIDSLEDLRAIPWVFSLNQSRFFLSSWYGVGTALEYLQSHEQDKWKLMSEVVSTWPPAQYVFTNIESSVYSADRGLMERYGALVTNESTRSEIMSLILNEYELTKELLNKLFQETFEVRRPRLLKTLNYRDKPLRVLHETQIELLKRWRESKLEGNTENPEILTNLLLATNAIAGGLRTTG